MGVALEPIGNGLALRVGGVDLEAGVGDADWGVLWAAWQQCHCLVFPAQPGLSVDAHVALLSRFGPLLEERLPGEQHCYVTNSAGRGTDDMSDGYRWGALTPHMDFTYTRYPADVISLYAEALPQRPTWTQFYSNVWPLERMPRELRDALLRYSIRCAHDLEAMRPDAALYREPRATGSATTQWHDWPLVRRHPRKPALEVLACTMQPERILELSDPATDDAESRALLARIFDDYLYVPENGYRHGWNPGDLVVWDNCALQHGRAELERDGGDRVLRRVSVCEAGNGIQESVEFLQLGNKADAFA